MVKIASESKNSIWATIIGVITILVGATGVFVQLQKSLNIIWQVKADVSKSGIWNLIKLRIFAFGLLLAITFFMMVSFIVLGMYSLSLYFGKANPGSGYGAAGIIILILLWIAYSSMIVFYGAEFTHAYAVQQDGYIPPDKKAVKQEGRKA